jgi:hypothetical protein
MSIFRRIFEFGSGAVPVNGDATAGPEMPAGRRFAVIGRKGPILQDMLRHLSGVGGTCDVFRSTATYLETVIAVAPGYYDTVFIIQDDLTGQAFGLTYVARATKKVSLPTRVFGVSTLFDHDDISPDIGSGLDGLLSAPVAGETVRALTRNPQAYPARPASVVPARPAARTNAFWAEAI